MREFMRMFIIASLSIIGVRRGRPLYKGRYSPPSVPTAQRGYEHALSQITCRTVIVWFGLGCAVDYS